ncbi:hypothetical protein [Azospirillum cavernae]|nr:hypothetical protein [Azospirillum cavernae]
MATSPSASPARFWVQRLNSRLADIKDHVPFLASGSVYVVSVVGGRMAMLGELFFEFGCRDERALYLDVRDWLIACAQGGNGSPGPFAPPRHAARQQRVPAINAVV